MKAKMVSYNWDELPSLMEKDRAELRVWAARPDSEIDLTDPDAPEFLPEAWANAVLAWLKSGGKGHQTRMNAILRRAMLDEFKANRAA